PSGAVPGRLAAGAPSPGTMVRVFGYPANRPDGVLVRASISGSVPRSRLQLDPVPGSTLRVQPGFSGSPAVDDTTGRIGGLVVAAEPEPLPGSGRVPMNDSYAISSDALREAWPEVLGSRPGGSLSPEQAWGWSLSEDREGARHWWPRARGVSVDSEQGFRF